MASPPPNAGDRLPPDWALQEPLGLNNPLLPPRPLGDRTAALLLKPLGTIQLAILDPDLASSSALPSERSPVPPPPPPIAATPTDSVRAEVTVSDRARVPQQNRPSSSAESPPALQRSSATPAPGSELTPSSPPQSSSPPPARESSAPLQGRSPQPSASVEPTSPLSPSQSPSTASERSREVLQRSEMVGESSPASQQTPIEPSSSQPFSPQRMGESQLPLQAKLGSSETSVAISDTTEQVTPSAAASSPPVSSTGDRFPSSPQPEALSTETLQRSPDASGSQSPPGNSPTTAPPMDADIATANRTEDLSTSDPSAEATPSSPSSTWSAQLETSSSFPRDSAPPPERSAPSTQLPPSSRPSQADPSTVVQRQPASSPLSPHPPALVPTQDGDSSDTATPPLAPSASNAPATSTESFPTEGSSAIAEPLQRSAPAPDSLRETELGEVALGPSEVIPPTVLQPSRDSTAQPDPLAKAVEAGLGVSSDPSIQAAPIPDDTSRTEAGGRSSFSIDQSPVPSGETGDRTTPQIQSSASETSVSVDPPAAPEFGTIQRQNSTELSAASSPLPDSDRADSLTTEPSSPTVSSRESGDRPLSQSENLAPQVAKFQDSVTATPELVQRQSAEPPTTLPPSADNTDLPSSSLTQSDRAIAAEAGEYPLPPIESPSARGAESLETAAVSTPEIVQRQSAPELSRTPPQSPVISEAIDSSSSAQTRAISDVEAGGDRPLAPTDFPTPEVTAAADSPSSSETIQRQDFTGPPESPQSPDRADVPDSTAPEAYLPTVDLPGGSDRPLAPTDYPIPEVTTSADSPSLSETIQRQDFTSPSESPQSPDRADVPGSSSPEAYRPKVDLPGGSDRPLAPTDYPIPEVTASSDSPSSSETIQRQDFTGPPESPQLPDNADVPGSTSEAYRPTVDLPGGGDRPLAPTDYNPNPEVTASSDSPSSSETIQRQDFTGPPESPQLPDNADVPGSTSEAYRPTVDLPEGGDRPLAPTDFPTPEVAAADSPIATTSETIQRQDSTDPSEPLQSPDNTDVPGSAASEPYNPTVDLSERGDRPLAPNNSPNPEVNVSADSPSSSETIQRQDFTSPSESSQSPDRADVPDSTSPEAYRPTVDLPTGGDRPLAPTDFPTPEVNVSADSPSSSETIQRQDFTGSPESPQLPDNADVPSSTSEAYRPTVDLPEGGDRPLTPTDFPTPEVTASAGSPSLSETIQRQDFTSPSESPQSPDRADVPSSTAPETYRPTVDLPEGGDRPLSPTELPAPETTESTNSPTVSTSETIQRQGSTDPSESSQSSDNANVPSSALAPLPSPTVDLPEKSDRVSPPPETPQLQTHADTSTASATPIQRQLAPTESEGVTLSRNRSSETIERSPISPPDRPSALTASPPSERSQRDDRDRSTTPAPDSVSNDRDSAIPPPPSPVSPATSILPDSIQHSSSGQPTDLANPQPDPSVSDSATALPSDPLRKSSTPLPHPIDRAAAPHSQPIQRSPHPDPQTESPHPSTRQSQPVASTLSAPQLSPASTPLSQSTADASATQSQIPPLPRVLQRLSILKPLVTSQPLIARAIAEPDDLPQSSSSSTPTPTPPANRDRPSIPAYTPVVPTRSPAPAPIAQRRDRPSRQLESLSLSGDRPRLPAPSAPTLQLSKAANLPPQSASAVPQQWSSLEDLFSAGTTPPQPPPNSRALSRSPDPPIVQARSESPNGLSPPPSAPITLQSDATGEAKARQLNQHIDILARTIYPLLKQRLAIERERQGGSAGRLPW
ncbi:hypothetical protein [Synechococcus sp. PCC 7336]|uniref:hypothetical protein n=1 Tax=Synechococcus sp. PCC 7336 TaxID=195250 RepID=UPI00034D3F5F|nr:hypothetical protein [Synechococcus sp. PCC 7336]